MSDALEQQLDLGLLNVTIKEEPIDIDDTEEKPELVHPDLDIKDEIKEEIDTNLNHSVTDCEIEYPSAGQNEIVLPNNVDLDNFIHDHEFLCIKEEPNEQSSITNNDAQNSTSTETEISERIEDITSNINKHISDSLRSENYDEKEYEANSGSPVRKSVINDEKKMSRYQYVELKRLEIDMVVESSRRSRKRNLSNAKTTSLLPSAANQTSNRNDPERQAKSIHSDQMAYHRKFLEVRNRSSNRLMPNRRRNSPFKVKLEPEGSIDESLLQDNTFSCSKCSFTSDKKRLLSQHEYGHNVKKLPIYNCAFCGQKYTKRYLFSHMASVHPGQKYEIMDKEVYKCPSKCPECSFSAESKLRLRQHVKGHELNPTMRCPNCEYKSTPKDLSQHMNICLKKNTLLKCSFGQTENKSKIKLEQHLESKHNIHQTFICEICAFSCDDVKLYKLHILVHDQNNKIMKTCPYCECRNTIGALKGHIYLVHNIRIEAPEKKENYLHTLKCSKCPFITKLPTELKLHIDSHNYVKQEKALETNHIQNTEYIFKCKQCSFEINVLQDFLDHQLIHRQNELTCRLGSFGSVTLGELGLNMEKHKVTKCDFCDFESTPRKVALHRKEHLQTTNTAEKHEERRQGASKCQKCLFELDPLSDKDSHQCIDNKSPLLLQNITEMKPDELNVKQIHLIEHNYSRSSFALVEKSSMDKTECPLTCNQCPFTCVDPGGLTNHMKSHLQNKTSRHGRFKCKICYFACRTRKQFAGHVLAHKLRPPIEKCKFCDFQSTQRQVRLHRRKKHQITRPKNVKDIKRHLEKPQMMELFTEGTSRNSISMCEHCSFTSATQASLRFHMISHRLNQPIEKCIYCHYKSTPKHLQQHMLIHEMIYTSETLHKTDDKIEYKCESSPDISDKQEASTCHTLDGMEIYANESQNLQVLKQSEYKCDQCSFSGKVLRSFKRHQVAHQENQPVTQCSYCPFKSTPRCLKEHMRLVHAHTKNYTGQSKLPVEVQVPTLLEKGVLKQEPRPSEFDESQVQIKDEYPDQSKNSSPSQFNSPGTIESPLNNVPNKKKNKKNKVIFYCSLCPYSSTLRFKLNLHKKKAHRSSPPLGNKSSIKKSACDLQTNRNACKKTTIDTELSDTAPDFDQSDYEEVKCKWCSGTFAKCRLDMHIVTHDTQKNIKCLKCDFISTPRWLMWHMKNQHQLGPEAIKLCLLARNKSTDSTNRNDSSPNVANKNVSAKPQIIPSKLNQPTALKPFSQIFKCQICPFFSNLRIKLKCHMKKVHSNTISSNGNFVCNLCSWSTSVKSALGRHVDGHYISNQPIYGCQYCKAKGSKVQIIRFHNVCVMPRKSRCLPPKIVPLNCRTCRFTTHFPAELKRHEDECKNQEANRRMGLINKFHCMYCKFWTFWNIVLIRHLKSHHNETLNVKEERF